MAWVEELRGGQALARLLGVPRVRFILDVGSGTGAHADVMRDFGKVVTTISMQPPADHVGDFLEWQGQPGSFDAVWACHVLEHQQDVGAFLAACRRQLRDGGILAVTVPPPKHEIVGGHLTLWNAGLLIYSLVLAGFDCSDAMVGTYNYNISVIAKKRDIALPPLAFDNGDIDRLAQFFPCRVAEGFDGRLPDINWEA
jgi:SAM-dependent methyltransferase